MAKSRSLVVTHPDIAAEWDFEKNGSLTPSEVSKGKVQKVFWKCSQGHSYSARIDHRCSMHSGCPYCAGTLPVKGENDFATLYPELAAEWDYQRNPTSPTEFLSYSNKAVYWICPFCNESYQRKIIERTTKGFACPNCTGERHTSRQEQTIFYYLSKVTDVQNRIKIEGNEIDIYLPFFNIGIEYHGEYYHQTRLLNDLSKIASLSNAGVRLITISCDRERHISDNKIVLQTKAMTNPSDEELSWGITQLFSLLSLPTPDICIRRDMIDIYGLYIKSIKDNSIAHVYPTIASEWDYEKNKHINPEAFSYGSRKKVWWKCPKCHMSYEMVISNRTIGNSGCPYCSGKKIAVGVNDLTTTHPELAQEWDYEVNNHAPESFSKGSDYKAGWICKTCAHKWSATISSRTQGTGCPCCAGKIIIPGQNDFETKHPDAAKLWNYEKNAGKRPCEFKEYSNKKMWWICDQCGHEWTASVGSITRGRRCPKCAKTKRRLSRSETYLRKIGSLAEQHPELLLEWDYAQNLDLSPEKVTPGSSRKIWWKCHKCAHQWQANIHSRASGTGCPQCAIKK